MALLPFTQLIDGAKTIPGAVWGTIFGAIWGSLFGLLTSTLTERRSTARAEAQRQHESEEKTRDRTMTLRREVYLPVAAEYNAAVKFLSTMPSYTIDEIAKAKPLEQFAASAAKLALVSSQETAIAAQKLSTECGAIYLRFAPMAMEISATRGLADVHTRTREKYLADMEKVSQSTGDMLESGENNDVRVAGLQLRNGTLHRLFEREGKKLDDVNRKANELHKEYGLQFLPHLKALLELGVKVVVSMRRDLGQESNVSDFEDQARASSDRMFSMAEEVLKGMNPEPQNGA